MVRRWKILQREYAACRPESPVPVAIMQTGHGHSFDAGDMCELTSAQINADMTFFPGDHKKNNIPGREVPFWYGPSCFYLPGRAARKLDVEKIIVYKHDEPGAIHSISIGSAQTVRCALPTYDIRTDVSFYFIRSFVMRNF